MGVDVITAICAVAIAYFAWLGLGAWKSELIGKRKAELAEDVLSDFYRASDQIKTIRSPFSYPNEESKGRERDEGETPEETAVLNSHFVPIARIEKRSEFFSDLLAKKYRMKAYFGDQVEEPFSAIALTINKIQNAASMMMREAQSSRGKPKTELWSSWEETIWSDVRVDGVDQIANEVKIAVSEIEKICGPFLEARKS